MANKTIQTGVSPTRAENFPEWYQQVVRSAELAENSPVRGCMVIKPWGYGIWENLQAELDRRIKDTGAENAYFPLLIPISFLEKEAAHVEGFAKECAVVTHHRLSLVDGKLIPTGELEEPLIVRPTSETIIGDAFAKWVQSYRDLPLMINQWANVFRWEMRTRLFLRTAEFLWQEGHTVHVDREDALKEVMTILELYRTFVQDVLAMPVVAGEKPSWERFPGAVQSFCIEAMMQDRKALQAGTSHYLGDNFAKASGIKFLSAEGELRYAHTTSWGCSTRLIGGLIMTHSDDDGLRVPPRVAPKQVVILPVIPKPELEGEILRACDELAEELRKVTFYGERVRVHIDKRDIRGGEKSWQWVKKGAPVRIEVGPRDVEAGVVSLYRRDQGVKERLTVPRAAIAAQLEQILGEIQNALFNQAAAYLSAYSYDGITRFEEIEEIFARDHEIQESETGEGKPASSGTTAPNAKAGAAVEEFGQKGRGGFVRAPLCLEGEGALEVEKQLSLRKLSVRCLPLDRGSVSGKSCIVTGLPATGEAIIAKSY